MSNYLFPYVGQERSRIPPVVKPVKAPPPKATPPAVITLPPMPPSLKKILFEVCEKHGVRVDDAIGTSRVKALIYARREYVWRARRETTSSFPRIAKVIGRDHTTAVHLYYQVERGEVALEVYTKKPKE